MNISVFGLGYVGCVSMACLAKAGHCVVGVDVKAPKIEQVDKGVPTIFEPGLDELMGQMHAKGRISATSSVSHAIQTTDISLITVGTPSLPDGELNLEYIFRVAEGIGQVLREKADFHTIAIRSTVKPGTCDRVAEIIANASGKTVYEDFSIVANPEFLREGSAIKDYLNPPYVLIGADDLRGADIVAAVYSDIEAEIHCIGLRAGEMIKYINNSWHALKVAFGNEVGAICKQLDIDSHEVMEVFLKDRALNISPHYLRPGYAYGGSCLPKDIGGLVSLAESKGVAVPVLSHVPVSNDQHIQRAIELVQSRGKKQIGFLGLTFKGGTDDVRNSPTLEIIRALLDQGFDIRVLDDDVNESWANQRNLETMQQLLGPITELMVNRPAELLAHAQTLVVAKNDAASRAVLESATTQDIVDLVHVKGLKENTNNYAGLAW